MYGAVLGHLHQYWQSDLEKIKKSFVGETTQLSSIDYFLGSTKHLLITYSDGLNGVSHGVNSPDTFITS